MHPKTKKKMKPALVNKLPAIHVERHYNIFDNELKSIVFFFFVGNTDLTALCAPELFRFSLLHKAVQQLH